MLVLTLIFTSIPVGQVSVLELPAGMIDNANDSITGTATKEMEEECGIKIRPSDLVDMTELACQDAVRAGHLPYAGIPSSPGGCNELIRYMYAERIVSKQDLDQMRGRTQGLREHGEYITLQVVSMEEMWKVSGDGKTMWYVSEDGVNSLCFSRDDNGTYVPFLTAHQRLVSGGATTKRRQIACPRRYIQTAILSRDSG